jgi:hypothetical protein
MGGFYFAESPNTGGSNGVSNGVFNGACAKNISLVGIIFF